MGLLQATENRKTKNYGEVLDEGLSKLYANDKMARFSMPRQNDSDFSKKGRGNANSGSQKIRKSSANGRQ